MWAGYTFGARFVPGVMSLTRDIGGLDNVGVLEDVRRLDNVGGQTAYYNYKLNG